MTLKELLNDSINKFNKKVSSDAQLQKELIGIRKKVLIDLGSEKYNFSLEENRISSVNDGEIADPDITVFSDPETFSGILSGRIKPMKAYALRKIRIKGSLEDLMHLRKLF
ncbi:MAG: SCP2 sterol-binding domain-containing protein [Methanomassiliicoccales archaeon]|jgi:putative sterol carrier protein|nr:SCP2 sterol-binding domain-containing protein [Methanomassiliicoccales archaeon]